MFDALEMSLQFLERLVPVETRIRQRSASLAKQLADASESIALNLGEGRLRHAGDKRRHFEMAAGSASEVTVALRIAVAKRYVTTAELAELEVVLDRLRAMNALARDLAQQVERILVGVDRDARRGLARLVQPRGIGRAELHPQA